LLANIWRRIVINAEVGGNVRFGDGPRRSRDDAKLARSTILACPRKEPEADDHVETR
jgi:hypothetical protein